MTYPQTSPAPAVRRKRHRWPFVLLGVIVLIVVLVIVAVFATDGFFRTAAVNQVKSGIASEVKVPSKSAIHVDLGATPILLQELSGKFSTVHLAVDRFSIGAFDAQAVADAKDVPLDAKKAVRKLSLVVTVPVASLRKALIGSDEIKQYNPTMTVKGGDLVLTMKIAVGSLTIPFGISIKPGVKDGKFTFAVDSADINGQHLNASQLDSSIPGLSEAFSSPSLACTAPLPKNVTIDSVKLDATSLVYSFSGKGVILSDTGSTAKSSC